MNKYKSSSISKSIAHTKYMTSLKEYLKEMLEKSIEYGEYGDDIKSPPINYAAYLYDDEKEERKKILKNRKKNINKLLR